MRAFIRRREVCPIVAALVAFGCGARATPPEPAPERTPPRPRVGALTSLVPAGVTMAVVARPRELLAAESTLALVDAVYPSDARDAFARRTGVEPADVDEVVWAEYEQGWITLARGPWPAADVVRAAEVRMNTIEVSRVEPWVRLTGYLGRDRFDLVALDEDVILVARGARPQVVALLGRLRHGGWGRAEGAFESGEGARLLAHHRSAPLALHAPHPIQALPGFDVGVLLAREEALCVVATPAEASPASVDLEVEIRGEFPPGAERNFRSLIESIGQSDLGGVLGIDSALETLSVHSQDRAVSIRLRLVSREVVRGLRMLFGAEIRELLDGPSEEG